MTNPQAEIHLRRAYDILTQVEKKMDDLQRQASAHSASLNEDGPFLAGMVGAWAGARALSGEKARLLSDVELASSEIARGIALDAGVAVDTPHGIVEPKGLRATSLFMRGHIELIYGTSQAAKQLFQQTLQVAEVPDAHYMLGLIWEDEYKPTEALTHFEKYLALEPNGEHSVSALREANAMKNYKKRFRGNWLLLFFLTCFYIVPGIFYWRAKYK